MRITDKHVFFWATQEVFSNWHPSTFTIDREEFNCAEQFMMYMKSKIFEDHETTIKIMQTNSPREQKAYGRTVRHFDAKVWDAVSYAVVLEANLAKFGQNPKMLEELLSTGDRVIVEASPYDNIWGIGMKQNDEGVDDPANWKGENRLGKVLMEVRSTLGAA